MHHTRRAVLCLVVCVGFVTAMVATPVAGHAAHDEEFLVELDTEGDATVSVTYAFDLDSDEERAAFEELQENATAKAEFVERFENRMQSVASDASNVTDREMSVSDASLDLEADGDVGLATVSISWQQLAAVEGDRLVVTEPFASGFDPGMAFTVTAPEDHEITTATPEPTSSGEVSATWESGADLNGFELVAEPTATDEDDTEGDGAGLGVLAALLALLAAGRIGIERRTDDHD